RGERLAPLRRYRRVFLDQVLGDPTQGLDTQGQWRNVQKEYVLDLSSQHGPLYRSSYGHGFHRVDTSLRRLTCHVFHELSYQPHPRHPADQNDLVDLVGGQLRVAHHLPYRLFGPRDDWPGDLFQLSPSQSEVEVLRPGGVARNERKVDVGRRQVGELNLP